MLEQDRQRLAVRGQAHAIGVLVRQTDFVQQRIGRIRVVLARFLTNVAQRQAGVAVVNRLDDLGAIDGHRQRLAELHILRVLGPVGRLLGVRECLVDEQRARIDVHVQQHDVEAGLIFVFLREREMSSSFINKYE